MIVFNLDNTLANCEHRNYFIDPEDEHPGYIRNFCSNCTPDNPHRAHRQIHKITGEEWKPDWDGFDNACHKDKVNRPGALILKSLVESNHLVEIWTGRSENVREKTIDWLKHKIWRNNNPSPINLLHRVKMRPLGNEEDEDTLKMQWLNEEDRAGIKIALAVESDEEMVKKWTEKGVPCIKVVPAD